MDSLFASGHIVDLILVAVALQATGLWAARRFADIGPGLGPLVWTLASGVGLMLAIRAGLTDAPWPVVGGFTLLGLVCHLADLRQRWR